MPVSWSTLRVKMILGTIEADEIIGLMWGMKIANIASEDDKREFKQLVMEFYEQSSTWDKRKINRAIKLIQDATGAPLIVAKSAPGNFNA